MSAFLLAVDTTSEFGSIALMRGGDGAPAELIEEVPLYSADGFAHVLFDEIEKLLAHQHVSLHEIDVFAAASGPGSFTGVRVGLTAVKGLAEATGRKAVAVSNLRALACFGTRPLRAVVIDARRGEVYGAVYDAEFEPVCEEVVIQLSDWLETIPRGDVEFITQETALRPLLPSGLPVLEAPRALAGAIGRIAMQQYLLGRAKDPADIDANYVRRSDAELLWKEPAG